MRPIFRFALGALGTTAFAVFYAWVTHRSLISYGAAGFIFSIPLTYYTLTKMGLIAPIHRSNRGNHPPPSDER